MEMMPISHNRSCGGPLGVTVIEPGDPTWEGMDSTAEQRQKCVSKERLNKWPFSNYQTHGKMSSDLNKKYVSGKISLSHSGAPIFALLLQRPCHPPPLFQVRSGSASVGFKPLTGCACGNRVGAQPWAWSVPKEGLLPGLLENETQCPGHQHIQSPQLTAVLENHLQTPCREEAFVFHF